MRSLRQFPPSLTISVARFLALALLTLALGAPATAPAQHPDRQRYIEESRTLISEGKLNEAAASLQTLRSLEGDRPDVLDKLATLYRWTSRNHELLETLLSLHLLVPPSDEIDEEILRLAVDAGRLEVAVEAFRRMIERRPGDQALRDRFLDFLVWKGLEAETERELRDRLAAGGGPEIRQRLIRFLVDANRRPEALAAYLAWAEEEPQNRALRERIADDLIALGYYRAAIGLKRMMAAEVPDDPGPRRAVVRLAGWIGDPELALPELLWLSDRIPEDAATAMEIARANAGLVRIEEAVRWATMAVELDPADTANREYLAQLLIWANRPFEAIERYEEILRHEPDHYRAHFVLGDLLHWEGRQTIARDHFLAAVRSVKALPEPEASGKEPQVILVRSMVRLGHYIEAVPAIEDLARRYPDDFEVLLRRGEVYYWVEWYERAVTLMRRLAEEYPDNEEVKRFLAACLVRNREPSEAGGIYDRLLLADPDDKGLLLDQTAVRLAAVRPDLALPLYRRVLELDPMKREAAFGVGYVSRQLSDRGLVRFRNEHASTSLSITSLDVSYQAVMPPAFILTASREWLQVKRNELTYATGVDHESALTTLGAEVEMGPFIGLGGSIGAYDDLGGLNPAWSGRLTFRPFKGSDITAGYRHHILWYDPETYLEEVGFRNRWEAQIVWPVDDSITLAAYGASEKIFISERDDDYYGQGNEAWGQAALHLSRIPRFDLQYRFRYFSFDYDDDYRADVGAVFHERETVHYLTALFEHNRLESLRLQFQDTFSYDAENNKRGNAAGVYGVFSPSGRNWLEAGATYLVSKEGDAPSEWRWITTVVFRHFF